MWAEQDGYSFSLGPQLGNSETGVRSIISQVWCPHSQVWGLIQAVSWMWPTHSSSRWPSVFISFGCCSKLPSIEWLNPARTYPFTALWKSSMGLTRPTSGCQEGCISFWSL